MSIEKRLDSSTSRTTIIDKILPLIGEVIWRFPPFRAYLDLTVEHQSNVGCRCLQTEQMLRTRYFQEKANP